MDGAGDLRIRGAPVVSALQYITFAAMVLAVILAGVVMIICEQNRKRELSR
jgi:hypothetical protein